MTITIFGATGMVGQQLVQQALFKNMQVRAFGRNVFTTYFPDNKNLELIKGALFDEEDVFCALNHSDAVLSVIGGALDGTDKARSLGMKNIISQMQKASVSRIIALGGLGVLQADTQTLIIDQEGFPAQYLAVSSEHKKAYQFLKASHLNWTFVCSPDIIDAGPTGAFYTNADYLPDPNHFKINSGDLAFFMLNELVKNEFVKHRVGISN